MKLGMCFPFNSEYFNGIYGELGSHTFSQDQRSLKYFILEFIRRSNSLRKLLKLQERTPVNYADLDFKVRQNA